MTPPRIELGTYSLEGCCSIHLSYGANVFWFSQLSPARQRQDSENGSSSHYTLAGHSRKVPLFGILDLSSAHSVRRTNRELLLPARLTGVSRSGGYALVRQKAQRMKATVPMFSGFHSLVPPDNGGILKMAAARITHSLAILEKSRCSGSSICHLLTPFAGQIGSCCSPPDRTMTKLRTVVRAPARRMQDLQRSGGGIHLSAKKRSG